jgi:hypothetical protein
LSGTNRVRYRLFSLSGSPVLEFQARVLFFSLLPLDADYKGIQTRTVRYRMVPMFWSWPGPVGAYDATFIDSVADPDPGSGDFCSFLTPGS